MSSFFAYHDARRIGVAGHERGHDRSVGNAQAFNPVDPELVINDGPGVVGGSHLAGADVVVDGVTEVANDTFPVVVGEWYVVCTSGVRLVVKFGAKFLQLFRGSYFESKLDPGDQRLNVQRIVEEVWLDSRMLERIGRMKENPAVNFINVKHAHFSYEFWHQAECN